MKRVAELARDLRDQVEPFWVGGLAGLLLEAARRWLPLKGESFEWAQYLLLGVVLPVLVLVLSFVRAYPEALRILRALLALACFLSVKYVFAGVSGWIALGLGLAQVGLLVIIHLLSRKQALLPLFPGGKTGPIVGTACMLAAWVFAVHWLWWKPFPEWSVSWQPLGVLLVALALAAFCFFRLSVPSQPVSGRAWLVRHFMLFPAAILLFLASFRVHGSGLHNVEGNLYGHFSHHHWGAIVGPAHYVREGAWLLWDSPAHYGFLSTLAIAWMPIADIWQAAYFLNGILYFLTSGFLFYLLRSLRPGPLHDLFSLLLTMAAVFILPGMPQDLTGPYISPAVGPFRFVWCYVLVAVLYWEFRSAQRDLLGTGPLWLGSVAWLLGSFWSLESAVYCSVIWLPAYVLLILRRVLAWSPTLRYRGLTMIRWLCLPPVLVLATAAFIDLVYRLNLQEAPDWVMYAEYCRAFGVFALPINPRGTVWVLVGVFLAVATTAAFLLRSGSTLRDLPLLFGAGGALWATGSYFVGRSHEVNATNLTPFVVLAIAATLHVIQFHSAAWSTWVRLGFLPVLTMILVAGFWNGELGRGYLRDLARGYRGRVGFMLPTAEPPLQELLTEAGIDAKTPVLFMDNRPAWLHSCPLWKNDHGAVVTTLPTVWIAGAPLTTYIPLPQERSRIYFSRFAQRISRSGWLVQPDEPVHPALTWIPDQLAQTHRPGQTVTRKGWKLTWYEPRSKDRGAEKGP